MVHLKKNQNIIIFENEYTSNHLSILKKKKEFNEIKIVKLDKNGLIDLDDFKNKIDNKTKIVSINHICSQNGNVMPVEIVGNILKEENQDSIYIAISIKFETTFDFSLVLKFLNILISKQ